MTRAEFVEWYRQNVACFAEQPAASEPQPPAVAEAAAAAAASESRSAGARAPVSTPASHWWRRRRRGKEVAEQLESRAEAQQVDAGEAHGQLTGAGGGSDKRSRDVDAVAAVDAMETSGEGVAPVDGSRARRRWGGAVTALSFAETLARGARKKEKGELTRGLSLYISA